MTSAQSACCVAILTTLLVPVWGSFAEDVCLDEDFERGVVEQAPEGWGAFQEQSKPAAMVFTPGAGDSAKCLKMLPTSESGFVALSKALSAPQDRVWVELSFAFTEGKGRTFNLWSHEPDGKDASQINVSIGDGRLMQYGGVTKRWELITADVEPTTDPTQPIWHRMRVVADRDNPAVDFYVSEPGSTKLPEQPTNTLRVYRTGLPFGAIDLVSGARLAPGSYYLVDDLVVRGGSDVPGPQGEITTPEVYDLWDTSRPLPNAAETPLLEGACFSVIKKREVDVDGYNWLHGVAAVWHKGVLYSFFGHNEGDENTPTEIAQGRHSLDGGRTWSPVWMVAPHTETEGRSHGVFLSHGGQLWIFLGRFGSKFTNLRTEAYVLDERAEVTMDAAPGVWESQGIVAGQFWPCEEPVQMADGNWIMAGMDIPDGPKWAAPAVTISHGDNFTRWDTVILSVPGHLKSIWGESTTIVEPDEVRIVVRPGWSHDNALISTSRDFGRTWSPLEWTNLPSPSTKLYAGFLSTGQRYVVGTLVRDHSRKRHPLCIAVSNPGEKALSRMYRIRDDVLEDGPGESVKGAALSYPYAVEHEHHLYVVYSNDGGRGRNLNSGEMAVIPLEALMK